MVDPIGIEPTTSCMPCRLVLAYGCASVAGSSLSQLILD